MTTMARSPWSTDLTALCERLARRLDAEGAPHPLVAAVALAVRGHLGLDPSAAADHLGVDAAELAAVEAGEVAWADVPPAVRHAAQVTPGLDLPRLGLPT